MKKLILLFVLVISLASCSKKVGCHCSDSALRAGFGVVHSDYKSDTDTIIIKKNK